MTAPGQTRWPRLLLLACPPTLAFLLSVHPIDNFDLGFHLRTGEWILQHGIPATDPFSFTVAGEPWFLEQWLGATVFWLTYLGAGVRGVILLVAAGIACAFLLSTLAARRASGSATAAALAALLATVAAMPRFRAQPLALSLAGLALVNLAVEEHRATGRKRSAWLLLPLFLIWPHYHVGYLYGLAALGAHAAGALAEAFAPARLRSALAAPEAPAAVARTLCGVGLACLAGSAVSLALVHPLGLGVFARVFGIFASGFYRANYEEMQPLLTSYGVDAPVLLLWGLPPLLWLIARKPVRAGHLILWALFVWSGVQVGRLVAETSLVLVPVWATAAVAAWRALEEKGALQNLVRFGDPRGAAVAIALATALSAAGFWQLGYGHDTRWPEDLYPRRCYAWIEQHRLPDRMFNDMWFGGSFLFHFFPQRRVFIDGRTAYGQEFFDQVYAPLKQAAPGWEELASRLGLRWFLLTPTRFGRLHQALQHSPRWRPLFHDETCSIYGDVALARALAAPEGAAP